MRRLGRGNGALTEDAGMAVRARFRAAINLIP
jgi:hypothetical protein